MGMVLNYSEFKTWKEFAKRAIKVKSRYARVLYRIKSYPKGRKLRVLFIVSEAAKWKLQKVYEKMEASGVFEPIVGIAGWNRLSEYVCPDVDKLLEELHRVEAFFDKLGDRHVTTVRVVNGKREDIDFREFEPDIVYINEPWGPTDEGNVQFTRRISKYALTIYTAYFVSNYGEVEQEAHLPFHRYLYAFICTNEFWAKLFQKSYGFLQCSTKFIPLGHPALDYFNNGSATTESNTIIYAPHFSFVHPKQEPLHQAYGTLNWNGKEILEYAKNHPEFKWVFKPHPILKSALKRTEMFDADQYYAEWAKVGRVCEDGDYQDLFKESFAMITDCGSFLTEYAATGKPLIHLICKDNNLTPLPPSKMVYDTFYQVNDLNELKSTFKMVLEERKDPKKEKRQSAAKKAGLMDSHAAEKIVEYLKKLCKK